MIFLIFIEVVYNFKIIKGDHAPLLSRISRHEMIVKRGNALFVLKLRFYQLMVVK